MMTIMVIGIHQLTGEMSGSVVKKKQSEYVRNRFPRGLLCTLCPKKTSNFRKVVRQYTSVVEVLFFVGNLLLFPAVKEF